MTEDLSQKRCQPCEGGAKPLSPEEAKSKIAGLEGWQISSDGKSLFKEYLMKDFVSAVRFTNGIAEVAEKEDHHPDIHLTGYRKLRIELSTHSIGGISENDFILAAKIEKLPKDLKVKK